MVEWVKENFIVLDFETTSADPKVARPVEMGLIITNPENEIVEDFSVLVDAGVKIPEEATKIHGITTEDIRARGMSSKDVITKLIDVLVAYEELPIVIYNVPYDWGMVTEEIKRIGAHITAKVAHREMLFVDPLLIDRKLDKYRKGSRKLSDVCTHHKIDLEDAHSAKADAHATSKLLRALINKHSQLKTMSLEELYKKQTDWFSEWKRHTNNFWFRTGNPNKITNGWPI